MPKRGTLHIVSLALLCGVVACRRSDQAEKAVRPPVLAASGEHEAQTRGRARQIDLSIKRGFSVALRPLPPASELGEARLRVADPRVDARQIAERFVPIGPTVELSGPPALLDVSFLAENFRVRAGHRLVLAIERPCQTTAGCWEIVPASYAGGRCRAQPSSPVLRMQFGSLPEASLNDSAAR